MEFPVVLFYHTFVHGLIMEGPKVLEPVVEKGMRSMTVVEFREKKAEILYRATLSRERM